MSFTERYSTIHLALDSALEFVARAVTENPDGPITEGRFVQNLLGEWYSDRPRTAALRHLLIGHLPRLQPRDAADVLPRYRDRLYFELERKRNDPYFVAAILRGLTGLHDHRAEPYVRPLAEGQRCAAVYPIVQEAARAYLAGVAPRLG